MSCAMKCLLSEDLKNPICEKNKPNQRTDVCLENELFRIVIQQRDDKMMEIHSCGRTDCTCCMENERLKKLIKQKERNMIENHNCSLIQQDNRTGCKSYIEDVRLPKNIKKQDEEMVNYNCCQNQQNENSNVNYCSFDNEALRKIIDSYDDEQQNLQNQRMDCNGLLVKQRLQNIETIRNKYISDEIQEDQGTNCSCCLENERLLLVIQQKDDIIMEMKKDFEVFIDKVCVENKELERKLIVTEEKAYEEKIKQGEETREYKKQIEKLEEDLICCRRQVAKFLTSLDVESYKKTIRDQNEDIIRSDNKIKALTNRLRDMKESHICTLEENTHLRERLDRVKLVVNRAKLDVVEYCREIKKYDDMTLSMENQITRYQECLLKLQDRIRQEHMDKKALEELSEELNNELLVEKVHQSNLEENLKIMRKKNVQYSTCLRDYKRKLDDTTRELTCYKENLGHLRHILEVKRKSRTSDNATRIERDISDSLSRSYKSCDQISMACPKIYTGSIFNKLNSKTLLRMKRKYHLGPVTCNSSVSTSTQERIEKKTCTASTIKRKLNQNNSRLSDFVEKKFKSTPEKSLIRVSNTIRMS